MWEYRRLLQIFSVCLELGEGEVVQKHVPPLLVLDQVGQHEPELVPPVLEAAQLELALLNMAHYIIYAPD